MGWESDPCRCKAILLISSLLPAKPAVKMAAHIQSRFCCNALLSRWSSGGDPADEPHVFNMSLFFDLTPIFFKD